MKAIKRCGRCFVIKPLEDFHIHRARSDGRQSACKQCNLDAVKKHYYGDTDYPQTVSRRASIRKVKLIEVMSKIKSATGCHFCAENCSVALDFHHLDPREKEFELGKGEIKSVPRIEAELKKCVVLCSNCHRKVHAGLLNITSPREIDLSFLLLLKVSHLGAAPSEWRFGVSTAC